MNLHKSHRKTKGFVILVLSLIALLTMARLSCGTLFYVNRTDYAPHGIYIPTIDQTLHAGDFVIVELPVDVPALHVGKGFLLLKQVRGFAGDDYEITKNLLRVGGREYPIHRREGLPQQETGSCVVPEGKLLLLNAPEDSFDSRYLGPMDETLVRKKVRLWINLEGWWSL